jgi:hypothetical protein
MSEPSRAASREALQELYALLLERLLEEFRKPRVSAAYAMVARKLLKDAGITPSISAQADLRQSLEQLRSLSLPFVNTDPKKDTKQ